MSIFYCLAFVCDFRKNGRLESASTSVRDSLECAQNEWRTLEEVFSTVVQMQKQIGIAGGRKRIHFFQEQSRIERKLERMCDNSKKSLTELVAQEQVALGRYSFRAKRINHCSC